MKDRALPSDLESDYNRNLDMEDNLNLAIKAALDAGKAILEIYQTDFNFESKEDSSPVTKADLIANDVINDHLIATGIPIISEESKQTPFEIRKNWKKCWIVDPLDGTKEFIKKNGEFTVNIALVVDGIPKLGVIYAPIFQTIYFTSENASRSYKTVLTPKISSATGILKNAMEIRPVSKEKKVTKLLVSRSHLNEETRRFISKITNKEKTEIISMGSSLKFCHMAEGKADICPRFSPTMEWDTAAGQAICEAVGLQFLDTRSMESLKYNKNSLVNTSFIVSNNYGEYKKYSQLFKKIIVVIFSVVSIPLNRLCCLILWRINFTEKLKEWLYLRT
jgi:3'(2'), 5'-bisphosphate nucleotidase